MCYLGDNLLSPPTHNNSVYHKPFIVNPLRILLSLKNLKLDTISLVSQQFALIIHRFKEAQFQCQKFLSIFSSGT